MPTRLQAKLDRLNRDWPIGTEVRYWPGAKDGSARRGTIRSVWWALGHGEVVVKVTGYPGGIAASHVEPLTIAELEQERAALAAVVAAPESEPPTAASPPARSPSPGPPPAGPS